MKISERQGFDFIEREIIDVLVPFEGMPFTEETKAAMRQKMKEVVNYWKMCHSHTSPLYDMLFYNNQLAIVAANNYTAFLIKKYKQK
jgi:hypothetical protein